MSAVKLVDAGGKAALEQWLATAGLYKVQAFPFAQVSEWAKMMRENGANFRFDAYCPSCRERSHFKWILGGRIRHQTPPASLSVSSSGSSAGEKDAHYYILAVAPALAQPVFVCTRNDSHTIKFFLRAQLDGAGQHLCLAKIGQYPSLFDLMTPELERLGKLLGDHDRREFRSAELAASSGQYVAAFAYLRRVFEHRVEVAHAIAKKDTGWDEANYQANVHRMDERIQALRAHLPPFLVEHRSAYGVLSKGIHELSEEECSSSYTALHEALHLILEQEIERRTRAERETRLGGAIAKLSEKFVNQ